MLSKIKEIYLTTVIAFGNGGLPLGKRKDIDELAIIAHESKNPSLIRLFETLPPLEELKKSKVDAELMKAPALVRQKELPLDETKSSNSFTLKGAADKNS